jgi:DNA-binding transcriptional MerR regulator
MKTMSEYFMPISELSKKLDIPAHTLRFWEKEFPALIVPTTGAGNRRYYRRETIDNIAALKKHLYADGYTIDGVKKLVSQGKFHSAVAAKPEKSDSADIKTAIELLEQAQLELASE